MTSPIEKTKLDIQDLEKQRETLYEQFKDIEKKLKTKYVLLEAFNAVSNDPILYQSWQEQAKITPEPLDH